MKVHTGHKMAGIIRPRAGDAGFDIKSPQRMIIPSGDTVRINTRARVEIPRMNWLGRLLFRLVGLPCPEPALLIKDRSSMAYSEESSQIVSTLQISGGVIDNTYRGEISVVVTNLGRETAILHPGQRIAQGLIVLTFRPAVKNVKFAADLTVTQRGTLGFGSTGQ